MSMKTKHALTVFIAGILVTLAGSMFKIMHWPGANVQLILGISLEIVGGFLLLFKLITHPRLKEFLNR